MLRQQMRSCDCTQIEAVSVDSPTGPLREDFPSPTDTPSIAITNYNFHPNGRIEDSTLLLQRLSVDAPLEKCLQLPSLLRFQRTSVAAPPEIRLQLPSTESVCPYFDGCSQSTACNAIRFGECSSTSLDRLWYLYSYIYKPTTTICYGIFIFLNSRHTSPLRLLPSVKHTTTPSTSLPFFTTHSSTTRSNLQFLILLESTSAPSLSITSGLFFVNFITSIIFLYLAGVDKEDNDLDSTTRPDIRYEFESLLHASPFRLLAILEPTTPIISIALCPTCSASHLLAFLESTVHSFPLFSWTLFVIFFLSPVGAVGRDTGTGTVTLLQLGFSCGSTDIFWSQQLKISNSTYTTAPSTVPAIVTTILRSKQLKLLSYSTTSNIVHILRSRRPKLLSFNTAFSVAYTATSPVMRTTTPVGAVGCDTDFHLIDQGRVGYLYHLQILLFNLQDSSSSTTASSSPTVLLSAIDIQHDPLLYNPSSYNNDNDAHNISIQSLFNNDNNICGMMITLNTTAMLATTFDTAITMTIQVYSSSSSSPSELSYKHDDSDTYKATSSVARTTTSNELPSAIYDEDSSAGNDSPMTIMVATQVDSSRLSSSSYDTSYTGGANDNGMSSSTDDEAISASVPVPAAVTIMTTAIIIMTTDLSYDSNVPAITAAVTIMTTDIIMMTTVFHELPFAIHDDMVYFAAINTESSGIITITTVFHELPSTIHDGIFSAVADAVTRTTTSYAMPSYDIDFLPSAIIADEAQYDHYYGDTSVSIASPSIVTEFSTVSVDNIKASSADNDSPVTVLTTTPVDSSRSTSSSYGNDLDLYFDTVVDGHPSNNDNIYGDITVSNSVIVTLKTYNTIYDLPLGTVIAIIVAVAPAVAIGAPSVIKMKTYTTIFITLLCLHIIDQGSVLYLTLQILLYNQQYVYDDGNNNSVSSVTVISAVTMKIISYESYNAAHSVVAESPSAITFDTIPVAVTTKTYDMPSAIHDGIISADNNAVSSAAVTIMTTAVKMMTHDMNTAIYFAFIDTESSADITNMITLFASPSYDIDTESSAVSVADEATSAVSCYSSNYFSLISSRQFDQITSVPSTLMSLHRTLYLILTSLLLLIR